jgi:hypothetical protein
VFFVFFLFSRMNIGVVVLSLLLLCVPLVSMFPRSCSESNNDNDFKPLGPKGNSDGRFVWEQQKKYIQNQLQSSYG